jgi:hypothetical protein
MRTLDYIILIAAGIFAIKYVLPMFGQAFAYAASSNQELDTMKVRPVAKQSGGGAGENPVWGCITHRERLQVVNPNATVTGTVIASGDGKGPHYAPDGDLVFVLKPDAQYASMVNAANNGSKYQGGLWIEGVCQKANKAKEPRHQGDCKCNPPKFSAPKVGQKLKITGAHVKDVGEEGHMEVHPVYSMQVI